MRPSSIWTRRKHGPIFVRERLELETRNEGLRFVALQRTAGRGESLNTRFMGSVAQTG
jgi:hypothetical protein